MHFYVAGFSVIGGRLIQIRHLIVICILLSSAGTAAGGDTYTIAPADSEKWGQSTNPASQNCQLLFDAIGSELRYPAERTLRRLNTNQALKHWNDVMRRHGDPGWKPNTDIEVAAVLKTLVRDSAYVEITRALLPNNPKFDANLLKKIVAAVARDLKISESDSALSFALALHTKLQTHFSTLTNEINLPAKIEGLGLGVNFVFFDSEKEFRYIFLNSTALTPFQAADLTYLYFGGRRNLMEALLIELQKADPDEFKRLRRTYRRSVAAPPPR